VADAVVLAGRADADISQIDHHQMRLRPRPTTLRAIAIAAPLLAGAPLHAQGYCAQFADGSSPDCGFSTLQMCEASVTGVGGVCLNNPSGPSAPAAPPPQLPLPPGQTNYQLFPAQPPTQQQSSGAQPCNPVIDGTYCASAGGNAAVVSQSSSGMPAMQSLSSDLGIGGDTAATLGGINISGGSTCIGLFRRMSCGG
jgi:hypothetical protein